VTGDCVSMCMCMCMCESVLPARHRAARSCSPAHAGGRADRAAGPLFADSAEYLVLWPHRDGQLHTVHMCGRSYSRLTNPPSSLMSLLLVSVARPLALSLRLPDIPCICSTQAGWPQACPSMPCPALARSCPQPAPMPASRAPAKQLARTCTRTLPHTQRGPPPWAPLLQSWCRCCWR
jgi:hypothetical protein